MGATVRTADQSTAKEGMKLVGASRRGMPTLYGIVEYWRGRRGVVFPNLKASYIGWGEPFCFRCGWLAPVDDTQATLAVVWNSARGWLDRAHLQDLALGGSNGPENLVPLCRQCHDIMDPYESRAEAIAYVNDGIPADSWWQMHTDVVFGSEVSLDVSYKTKIMRDVYTRWVEQMRVIEVAKRGNPQAVKRLETILDGARRNGGRQGRIFAVTIDHLRACSLVGDGSSAM
ncbi:HNH endonuclease [Salinispora tropica]|uniref:HNH endonuclease n=1 Tax=Salinispora tropica TaxID=168695 RepID=UPI001E649386|nr:HNH endonuclease [Salinispora tropica]